MGHGGARGREPEGLVLGEGDIEVAAGVEQLEAHSLADSGVDDNENSVPQWVPCLGPARSVSTVCDAIGHKPGVGVRSLEAEARVQVNGGLLECGRLGQEVPEVVHGLGGHAKHA